MPELKNIRIALSGIYPYRVDELASLRLPPAPEWAKGKEFYNVYRPAIVLKKAVNLFSNLPLTHNHPQTPVNGDNFRNLALGWTGEKPFIDVVDNEVGIRSTLIMYDDEALTAYNNGEIQLSPGYVGSFSWQHGYAPDGQEYDIIMNNIDSVNHLALLPIGRGGDNAVVLDTGENIPKRKTVFDYVKDLIKDTGENNLSLFDFIALRNEIADVLEMQAETEDAGALVTDVKYAEGTVRTRKDGDYRKQSGKWVKIYSGEGRGASLAVTHAVKKIKAAKNVDELMDLVNANISRFYDKNGKLLPVVARLRDAVNESKTRINSAKKLKVKVQPFSDIAKISKDQYGKGYHIDFTSPTGGMNYTYYYNSREAAEKAYNTYKKDSLEELQKKTPTAESVNKNIDFSKYADNIKEKIVTLQKNKDSLIKQSKELQKKYNAAMDKARFLKSTTGEEMAKKYADLADKYYRQSRSVNYDIDKYEGIQKIVNAMQEAKNIAIKDIKSQSDLKKLYDIQNTLFSLSNKGYTISRAEDYKVGDVLYSPNPYNGTIRKVKVKEIDPIRGIITTDRKVSENASSTKNSFSSTFLFREDGSIPGLDSFFEKQGIKTTAFR
jgi:hypothetical protein